MDKIATPEAIANDAGLQTIYVVRESGRIETGQRLTLALLPRDRAYYVEESRCPRWMQCAMGSHSYAEPVAETDVPTAVRSMHDAQ